MSEFDGLLSLHVVASFFNTKFSIVPKPSILFDTFNTIISSEMYQRTLLCRVRNVFTNSVCMSE